jgi:hypothetical protein
MLEQLTDSIAAERHKFTDEANLRGDEVTSIQGSFGSIVAAAPRADPDRLARRLDSAAEFDRRVHDRAAEVLTASQLAAFEEMQSEALSVMRNNIRNEEVLSAARTPTSAR